MVQRHDPDAIGSQPAMDVPDIAPREQWRKARIDLLEKEKALTRQRDALDDEAPPGRSNAPPVGSVRRHDEYREPLPGA